MMKDFWNTGLASVKSPKATAFAKSGISSLKLPCDISQPVLRDNSLILKTICKKETSHQTRLSTLAFMPPANKVQKINKTKHQLKKHQQQAEQVRWLVGKCFKGMLFPPVKS